MRTMKRALLVAAMTGAAMTGMAGVLAAPALAGEPTTVLMPEDPRARAFQEEFGYADAVIAGDTIYLSGVVAGPREGDDGLEPAFERAFQRIGATLARAGASWADVVDLTTFHTDLRGSIDALAAVKNRHVKAPFPAWTAIGVSTLYAPTAVVEIKVVARRPQR